MKQSCLGETACQKLFTWRKIIPPKWDLTCVGVRSQVGGMNPFSYKRFAFRKWNTPFCRDLTQVRHFTRVGWFFSDKQLLNLCLRLKKLFHILSDIKQEIHTFIFYFFCLSYSHFCPFLRHLSLGFKEDSCFPGRCTLACKFLFILRHRFLRLSNSSQQQQLKLR